MGAKGRKGINTTQHPPGRPKEEVTIVDTKTPFGKRSYFKESETTARMRVYRTEKTQDKIYKNSDTMQKARESYKLKGIKTRRLKKI